MINSNQDIPEYLATWNITNDDRWRLVCVQCVGCNEVFDTLTGDAVPESWKFHRLSCIPLREYIERARLAKASIKE